MYNSDSKKRNAYFRKIVVFPEEFSLPMDHILCECLQIHIQASGQFANTHPRLIEKTEISIHCHFAFSPIKPLTFINYNGSHVLHTTP